jgi:mono/diheme cytochrome c family protein
MKTKPILAIVAAIAVGLPSVAAAQTPAGEIEYMQACASCHGASGHGDGPVASFMNKPVPDLTQISARNDGVFPFQDLLEMIDGRYSERQPGPHGTAMPVWGDRFMMESAGQSRVEDEINTLGRMSSLVYFLYNIQE